MQIDVDYTLEDFKEGNTFMLLNTTVSRKLNYYFARIGYPALTIVCLALAYLIWFSERRFSSGVVESLSIASLMSFAWYRFGSAVKRGYKLQQRQLQRVLTLDDSGIGTVRKDGSANSHFLWSAVEKWAERRNAMLLILGPCSYLRVPSEQMSAEERAQVRGWLAEVPKVK